MTQQPQVFLGNCNTGVARQANYRVISQGNDHVVAVQIDTADGYRLYPTSTTHPLLVHIVNKVKESVNGVLGGQFYINEFRQVIVPSGDPVDYYLAGEYPLDVVLDLDGEEFSGRPLDNSGNLLQPGQQWTGRPRPGLQYILKAGGQDVEYVREISPGREKVNLLSKVVGAPNAKRTAQKIARVRGNKGGRFYINEYRAMFAPIADDNGWDYKFLGILSKDDPWFPKWTPGSDDSAPSPTPFPQTPSPDLPSPVSPATSATSAPKGEAPPSTPAPSAFLQTSAPNTRSIAIADGETGYTYDLLFGHCLTGAKVIEVEDPFLRLSHQLGNLLRFCELLVRLGTCKRLVVHTRRPDDEALAVMETIRRSLEAHGLALEVRFDEVFHDRRVVADNGWIIHLGRGLDIYKKPEDFRGVGATDFFLRPCYKTNIVYERTKPSAADCA